MTTRTLSIPLFVGGGSTLTGPTVNVGDTITLTVTAAGSSGTAASNSPSGCNTVGNITLGTATANAVTNFSGTSYSFQFTHTSANTTVYFRNVSGTINASTTAPVVNNTQSFAATASATTTCAIALTSNGSGGTLQYNKSTSTTVPTSGWQSSSTVSVTRGTSYYLWARRGVGSEDRTNSAIAVPYLANDLTGVAGTNSNIGPTATTASTTISGVVANHTYVIIKNNGTHQRSATFTANGAVTISDNGVPSPAGLPALGGSFTYEFMAYRNQNVGGNPTFVQTNRQFTISRTPAAPTDLSFVTATTESNLTNVTPTASGGAAGGTLQVSLDNSTWYTNGTSFGSRTRGTAHTWYARRLGSNGLASASYSEAHTPPYIAPDTTVTVTNDTIAWNATSATTTIGTANAVDQYFIRVNNGSTNLASRIGPGDLAFTSGLPAVGATITYEIFSRKSIANGGDNDYDATDDTFTVTRLVEPVTTPTDLVMSTAATASATPLVTATASGGSGGTLQVSHDNVNWYTNGSTFTRTRGTAYTFYARRVGSGSVTASYSEGYTPPYLAPDAAISAITSPDLAYGSTTHVVAIAGGNASDQYYVYNNAGSVSYGGRTGNGNITITHGVAAGGAATFRVYARKPVDIGGDNAFDDTGTTFEVEVFPNNVTISVSNDNPSAASVTATLSATGGQGGTIEYAKFSYSATTTYAQARGTTVTYYARSVGSNGLISQVSFVDHSVGYIAPDSAISAIASPDLAYGSTTHAVAIAGGNASDQYFVYNNTGTVNYGSRTGNGSITITHGVAAGGAATFRVYVRRPLAVGGDNAFDDTGTTFEVEVYPQTPTASVAFNNPNDNDVTATVTGSNTAGAASLAYSNGGTYVAGNTFAAVRGTAANYFVQSTGANGLTASGGTSGTPAYNAPDAAISAITSPDLAYGSTTHVVAIAGGSSIDEYYVYNNAGSVSYGGRTGNGNITITHGVAAGGAATFRVYARRSVAVGGDNAFDDTGTTFEVEVYPNNVVLSVSNNNPELANVTATLSATGGQGGTIEYAKTSYSATTTYAQARGTTVTYYARSVGSNGLISQVSFVNHSVGYIAPATYTRSDFTVLYDTAQHFDLLNSFPVNDNYEVLTGGYTGTVRGSQSGGGGSSSVIAVTNINTPGTNVTYYIRGYRAVAVGGDGLYDNMDTYIVGELPQASTVLGTFTDLGTESTSGTFRVIVTPGAGASSVQISLTNSSTNLQNNDTNLANVVRAGDRIFTRTTAANGTVQDGFLDTPATYLAPNTGSIAGTSSTIGPTATTGSTTVSGVLSGHTYVVKKNNGDNDKPRSAIFTANGALTISNNGVTNPPGLPLLGQEFFYEFLVYRNTAAGGAGAPAVDEDWVETNRQFSIKRAPDAPTNILTSVPDTQSATTSVFLNAIGGTTGGTLQVSDDNVSWFANGSEFQNKTRGTSYTFYARRLGTNNVTSDLYTHPAYEIPYIPPDPSVTATNDTIAFNDTTASTTVGDINTNNNYAVRLNNGSTNLGIVNSSVTSPAVITFSSSLPTVGNTTTYEIFAARREDTGGSGIYVATDDTFTVTRLVEPVTTPDGFNFTPTTTATANVSVTVEGTGGSGGTIEVSEDNTTWVANNSSFSSKTRGTEYTFYTRRVGSGSVTASYSEGYTPPYLFPDNTITVSPSTQQYTGVGSFNISVSDITADLGNNYQVRDSSGTIHENGTPAAGETQVTISVSDEPNANPETYKIFSMRLETKGGSGLYSDSGKTFTVSTSGSTGGITPPTIASVTDNAAVGSIVTTTINLSSTGQGGTLKYARNQSATPPATGWQDLSSFTNVPKNTVFYYHASQDEDTAGAFASPVQYAATDAAYGVLIKNSNNQSILDTRVDRHSTAIATGTLTVPVQTATVVSGRRYRIAITDSSGAGNTFGSFGAPNENSGTIFEATSSGTLGEDRRVGELISTGTNSIPGMTSINTNEVGILFTDEPVTGAASIPAYEINRLSGEFEISSKFSDTGNSTYTYKYIAVRY